MKRTVKAWAVVKRDVASGKVFPAMVRFAKGAADEIARRCNRGNTCFHYSARPCVFTFDDGRRAKGKSR